MSLWPLPLRNQLLPTPPLTFWPHVCFSCPPISLTQQGGCNPAPPPKCGSEGSPPHPSSSDTDLNDFLLFDSMIAVLVSSSSSSVTISTKGEKGEEGEQKEQTQRWCVSGGRVRAYAWGCATGPAPSTSTRQLQTREREREREKEQECPLWRPP